jgi:hypothetical protein
MRGCLFALLWIVGGFIVIAVAATIYDRMTPPLVGQPPGVGAEAPLIAAQRNVALLDFAWRKGGFETVMIATFTIKNDNDFAIKDMYVGCVLSARSGTTLGAASTTIYDTVPAHSRRTFREINLGAPVAIDFGQASAASCKLGQFARY